MEFPHITDTPYPNIPSALDPVNEFDYERWAEYETKIVLCNAPWGTSEVQIGQRVVGGLGKVVKFDNDRERDAWFDALPDKLEYSTPWRGFSQDKIQVNIPFDMAIKYNYCYIEYNPATGGDVLLDYEGVDGVRRIYYFIRDMQYRAPSNTEFTLLLDHWTTWINSISFMALGVERGHVAVKSTTVEQYLNNPIGNSEMLLHEDVVAANPAIKCGSGTPMVFNDGTQLAVFTATADIIRTLNNGRTKTLTNNIDTGDTITLYTVAVNISQLEEAMATINNTAPQIMATIQGIYIIDETHLELGSSTTIGGVQWRKVNGGKRTTSRRYTITKSDFNFDSKYAELAKLYTYPYSYLEVTDWRGGSHVVRVEETSGAVNVETMANIAAPFMAVQAALLGVGGGSRQEITFKNVKQLKYVSHGREYDYTFTWPIPCYAVYQQPSVDYDIHTVHDRAQQAENNTTAKQNAYDSNAAAEQNAYDSNAAAQTVADRTAETTKKNINVHNKMVSDNNADVRGANTLNTTNANAADNENVKIKAKHNKSMTAWDNYLTALGTAMEANTAMATTANNIAANAIGSVIQGVGSGALAGGLPGAAAGGLGGLAGVGLSAYFGVAANNITMTANNEICDAAIRVNILKNGGTDPQTGSVVDGIANELSAEVTANNNKFRSDTTAVNNELSRVTTKREVDETNKNAKRSRDAALDNSADIKAAADGNAARSRTAADGNADRSKTTADNAITRAIDQAGLGEPRIFGQYLAGNDTAIKPMGLDFSIITQDKSSIAYAGEQFLRYGYSVNRWFNYTTFKVCDRFSYWKCFDINTGPIQLPDQFVDRVKMLLLGGVTVYNRPEDILEATLYNNGV